MTPWMFALALGLLACGEKDPEDGDTGDGGGETTDEYAGGGCEEVSRTEVTDLDTPAEGFDWAPGELLKGAAGEFVGTATDTMGDGDYVAGGSFRLGDPVYAVDSEPTPSTSGTEEDASWYECPDYYETQVEVTLAIGEGLVGVEDAAATLYISSAEQGSFSVELDEDEASLDLVPEDVDLAEWDSYAFDLRGELDLDGWSGSVDFFAERSDSEVAEAMGATILEWELGGEEGGEP